MHPSALRLLSFALVVLATAFISLSCSDIRPGQRYDVLMDAGAEVASDPGRDVDGGAKDDGGDQVDAEADSGSMDVGEEDSWTMDVYDTDTDSSEVEVADSWQCDSDAGDICCVEDEDCTGLLLEDGENFCNPTICTDGRCVLEPAEPGTPCTDGNACTLGDSCQPDDEQMVCVPGMQSLDCDNQNPCTEDWCDPSQGCVHDPITVQCAESRCEDLAFYPAAVCLDGTCPDQVPINCDDGILCTDDSCDPATGCINTPQGGYCLIGGVCYTDGQAKPGSDCQDCTVEKSTTDWSNATDGTACGGGSWCTSGTCGKTCGSITCPVVGGYNASCNTKQHCEYANPDTTGWKQHDVWIYVPPGSFPMGSPESEGGDSREMPVHTVTFAKGYLIGKYPVTVVQYEACMAASPGTCTAPSTLDWDGNGWGTNTSGNGRSAHPQNGLTWAQSGAVCTWLGGRRPSEAEWEYAAKGPAHRKYPWGDTPAPTCSNNTAVFNEAGGTAGYGCGTGGTWVVGSKTAGASWSGTLDMSGNVWEWVEDWYHTNYTGAPTDGSAWVDPAGSNRVMRGGSFSRGASGMRSSYRDDAAPGGRQANGGGRCLRPLP